MLFVILLCIFNYVQTIEVNSIQGVPSASFIYHIDSPVSELKGFVELALSFTWSYTFA